MTNSTSPQGKSISPTALDSACQCDARNLYEKAGAPGYSPFAAGAIALGAAVHDAVRAIHETGDAGASGKAMVRDKPVAEVARRITEVCRERFPFADVWAVEQRFAFYCDVNHSVFQRGRIDYAPFSEGRCDAVIDLKTKSKVSPKLGDTLVSQDMNRQLFACAIACMVHSRAVALGSRQPADRPELGTWENPVPYAVVADAIEHAPLPEVWLLIWDKDHNRPVWRAHYISRAALREHLRLAQRKALIVLQYADKPPAEWPRSFNCADPWECPHKMRCASDLADPPEDAEEYAADLALVRLGRANRP